MSIDPRASSVASERERERESRALAINQHLHLVKGAERDKGVDIAKKGVASLTITNYFSYPPLTLDVPLKPTLVINCSEASNLCETAPRPLVRPSIPPFDLPPASP